MACTKSQTLQLVCVAYYVFLQHISFASDVYNDIHRHMTVSELQDVFHSHEIDNLPEYQVIHLHHKRDIDYLTDRNHVKHAAKDRTFGRQKVHNDKFVGSFNSLNSDKKSDETSDSNQQNYVNKLEYTTNEQRNAINATTTIGDEVFLPNAQSYKDSVGDGNGQDSRDADHKHLQLKAFGRYLNLKLKPTDGLIKKDGLKLFAIDSNATAQHGVDYVELEDHTEEHLGDIYQDEENEAAILVRPDKESGGFVIEGSIGKDLVIRPLPARLRRNNYTPDLSDDEMFLTQDDLSSEVSIDTGRPIRRRVKRGLDHLVHTPAHVIYKRKLNDDEYFGDYAYMEPDHLSKRFQRGANDNKSSGSRKKREAPYLIYPEILVIVDYDGYRLHGGDNLQIKRYFVSFWNGVDLRYKLLKGPRIRISIAGIIISRGRDATPYLERNRVGRDAIDSAAALTDMGKYLFKERRLPVYDIAVAITKLDMCRRQFANDPNCNRGTAGFAYVGGACVVNKRLEKVNSVAIIEDTGGFSGIIVAAHEVGHLLGAVHDGSPPPSYLGGPGAEKCRWEDGYIMSDLRHTERGFRWSPCSVQSFHHFLNGDTATCLFNSPHEDESLGRTLPGKLLTLDAQCRRDRGTSACFKDDRVCAQLFCFDSGSGYCVAYRPAAEGSPCGDGQYCMNGRCVVEHENIIPDYSQNTPSFARRTDDFSIIKSSELTFDTSSTQNRPSFLNPTTQMYNYPQTTTTAKPSYIYYTTRPMPITQNYQYYTQPPTFPPITTPANQFVNKYNNYLSNLFTTTTTTPRAVKKPETLEAKNIFDSYFTNVRWFTFTTRAPSVFNEFIDGNNNLKRRSSNYWAPSNRVSVTANQTDGARNGLTSFFGLG